MALVSCSCRMAQAIKQNLRRRVHTEQKINVYGKKINFVQAGEGDKTLLLMPGALGCAWTDFRPQIEQLPELLPEHTIIAWDPPGCGKSVPSERLYDLNLFQTDANCAIDLMEALNRNSFSVLGWNTGGTTALMMAGRFPQFVDKLVVWGSSAFFTAEEIKKLDEIRGVNSMRKIYDIGKPLKTYYGEERFSKMWPCYMSAMEKLLCAQNGNICKTEVDCIQAPTLILHGGKDPIITLDHIQFLLRHIKNSKFFEFPDGRHDIHINEPAAFNKHVSKFLLEKPQLP